MAVRPNGSNTNGRSNARGGRGGYGNGSGYGGYGFGMPAEMFRETQPDFSSQDVEKVDYVEGIRSILGWCSVSMAVRGIAWVCLVNGMTTSYNVFIYVPIIISFVVLCIFFYSFEKKDFIDSNTRWKLFFFLCGHLLGLLLHLHFWSA